MLKRNRNNYWQDRYFIFESDQTLSYWRKQSKKDKTVMNEPGKNGAIDSKFPRTSFKISRQAGCDVSDLYVEQRNPSSLTTSSGTVSPTSGRKVTLYCIDISWTEDAEADVVASTMHQHNNSLEEFMIPQQDEDPSNNWDELSLNSSNSAARRRKPSFLRRRKIGKRGKPFDVNFDLDDNGMDYSNNGIHLNDLPSPLPSPSPLRRPATLRRHSSAPTKAFMRDLPLLEEKDTTNQSFELNGIAKTRSTDEGDIFEQEKLHNQFVNKQRKLRSDKAKRMVDATKVAVAAGAAVGVGVVTAGVGLAAGLVFLGGAAAIGGTAGVAEAGYKRRLKKEGQSDNC